MDIQTVLEYLVSHGGPDGVKAVAFAKVNPADTDEVKAAIAIFGYVWTGLQVLDINQADFSSGRPWDYSPAAQVDGGHSVVTGGYGTPGTGALGGDERFETWAQETSFTDSFWAHEVEECWVVIWPEHLETRAFLNGINLTALAADYQSLTGRPFPVQPSPAPTPAPVPVPVPVPVPPAPAADPDVAYGFDPELIAWAARPHAMAGNRYAAERYNSWRAARGYVGA